MSEWNEEDKKAWKAVATRQLDSLQISRSRIMEEHSAAFRWLMASLLAINGAGLLAIDGVSNLQSWPVAIAGLSFYLGCGCALMVAVMGQRASQAGVEALSHAIAFWTVTELTGEYKQEENDTALAQNSIAIEKSKKAPRVGWASFGLFSLGLIFLVVAKQPIYENPVVQKTKSNAEVKSKSLSETKR